jgi:hypothetical protein
MLLTVVKFLFSTINFGQKLLHESVPHSYRDIIKQIPEALVYIWSQVQMSNYRIKYGIITNNIKCQIGLHHCDGIVKTIEMDISFNNF